MPLNARQLVAEAEALVRQSERIFAEAVDPTDKDVAESEWRMRWKPLGRTCIRKRRMNSWVGSVMVLYRPGPSMR
jgi:hypothetical protein